MNTLTRLDSSVVSLFAPLIPKKPSTSSSSSPSKTKPPSPLRRGSAHPSKAVPRRARRRRPKPTTTSIKVPPPSTPLLIRILLALWSILLSFWQSLVGETRAERYKRRRRAEGLLQGLTGDIDGSGSEVEPEGDGDAEADADGSGTDGELLGGDDDGWVDPVTRAPVDTVPEEEDEQQISGEAAFTFRLRSADSQEKLRARDTNVPPPSELAALSSILENPLPMTRHKRLLPNPMSTSLLDPSVPAIPASQTITTTSPNSKIIRHQTPFHLQKTLILDLDETLIHSTSRPLSYSASSGGGLLGLSFGGLLGGRGKRREGHTVEVVLRGRSTTYHVYKRPYVDHFLKKVASWYTLVIFTASMPEYADPVIDWLDGGRGLFAKKLYRDHCELQPNGSYIKDLSIVESDLSRVCFMDNSPISYSWNKANALPVEGWTSDPNDEALLHCIPVLDSLRFVNDVRRVLGIRGFF